MATTLIIFGAFAQAAGLGLVFIELAIIRSHEFQVPVWWAGAEARLRRLLGRTKIVRLRSSLSTGGEIQAEVKVRPGPLDADATAAERIAWMEQYIGHLHRDVDNLHQEIKLRAREAIAASQKGDQELRDELDRRDEQRRHRLQPSIRRQQIGGCLVFFGLVFSAVGSLW